MNYELLIQDMNFCIWSKIFDVEQTKIKNKNKEKCIWYSFSSKIFSGRVKESENCKKQSS